MTAKRAKKAPRPNTKAKKAYVPVAAKLPAKPKKPLKKPDRVSDFEAGVMVGMHRMDASISHIAEVCKVSRGCARTHITAKVPPSERKAVRGPDAAQLIEIKKRRAKVAVLGKQIVTKQRNASTAKVYKCKPIIHTVKLIKHPSPESMAKALYTDYDIEASASTVRRDLEEMGWQLKLRGRSPPMNAKQKDTRLKFCRAAVKLSDADLAKWVFTDEKWFNSNDHSSNFQWCAPGQKPLKKEKVQKAPQVFLWGGIVNGEIIVLALIPFAEMLQAEREVKAAKDLAAKQKFSKLTKSEKMKINNVIQKEELAAAEKIAMCAAKRRKRGQPAAKIRVPKADTEARALDTPRYDKYVLQPAAAFLKKGGRLLMQDGAKCHNCPKVLARLGIKPIPLPWPGNSPDLNPIENLWSILQAKVHRKGPWNTEELKQFAMEAVQEVEQSTVDGLCLSFRARCKACIKANGGLVKM
jgi:hypothetical protein